MKNWQVGDLAVCIHRGRWKKPKRFLGLKVWHYHNKGPRRGEINKVVVIDAQGPQVYLGFHKWPGEGWDCDGFRKVVHDEARACDTTFLKKIKKCTQRVDADADA